jgi:hypothetical protein
LLRLRDLGDTEVGGFALSAKDDLLLVEDVCLVKQRCCPVSVKFDDESVADYFDRQVDLGRAPERFARIWIHTHPEDCPNPSYTDEETFGRCFGTSDWAVMFILARGGQTYARLRFNAGPGGALVLPVEIDFRRPFAAADWAAWDAEYARSVVTEPVRQPRRRTADRAKADESPRRQLDRLWDQMFWGDEPEGTGPFDDEFPAYSFPEIENEQLDAPF